MGTEWRGCRKRYRLVQAGAGWIEKRVKKSGRLANNVPLNGRYGRTIVHSMESTCMNGRCVCGVRQKAIECTYRWKYHRVTPISPTCIFYAFSTHGACYTHTTYNRLVHRAQIYTYSYIIL